MDKKQIKKELDLHKKWLNDERGGKKAYLRDANLRGAYLCDANLRDANLRGAYLCDANLRGADLRGADLRGAYLCDANLCGANLRGADLRGADLRGADLRGADLRGADLRGADLRDANLCDANLRGAYLRDANLRGAYLRDANLRGAKGLHFQICPEVGSFYAWKKTTDGIIKIQIPAKAKRTSCIRSRKCRASEIKVISGAGCGGKSPTQGNLTYIKGKIVKADSFNDDVREECTHGIHFFMTMAEAEEW